MANISSYKLINNVCTGLRFYIFTTLCVFMYCDVNASFVEDTTVFDSSDEIAAHIKLQESMEELEYSTDEIRCHCNLPECVTTGYMCKIGDGGCFVEVVDHHKLSASGIYYGRHGCLNKNQRDICRNNVQHRKLSCCFKDMCNHIDIRDQHFIFNGSFSEYINMEGPSLDQNVSASLGFSNSDIWFKVAIIAVPICGIVILILLIFLAVKILRTDSINTSNKLGTTYNHNSDRKSNRYHFDQIHHQPITLKKVPLLTHHHQLENQEMYNACTNVSAAEELLKHQSTVPVLMQNETGLSYLYNQKNEANAKLNTTVHAEKYNKNNTELIGLHKPLNCNINSVYKNVNLSVCLTPVSHQQPVKEKLYDKQVLRAVIKWGTPSPSSNPV